MAPRLSTARKNAVTDGLVDALDAGAGAGKLRLYTGTQPAGGPAAAATGTLLVEFTLQDPAFGASSGGIAFCITPGGAISVSATASGTPGWYRALDSNNLAVWDGGMADIDIYPGSSTILGVTLGTTVKLRSWAVGIPQNL